MGWTLEEIRSAAVREEIANMTSAEPVAAWRAPSLQYIAICTGETFAWKGANGEIQSAPISNLLSFLYASLGHSARVPDYARNSAALVPGGAVMVPVYSFAPFYELTDTAGEVVAVPADCVGANPSLEDFRPFTIGEPESFEFSSAAVFWRLSMPGCSDATEWSPADSYAEALETCWRTFDIDPISGVSLDGGE